MLLIKNLHARVCTQMFMQTIWALSFVKQLWACNRLRSLFLHGFSRQVTVHPSAAPKAPRFAAVRSVECSLCKEEPAQRPV